MPQLFSPAANTIARIGLLAVVLAVAGLLWTLALSVRSSYATGVGIPYVQPAPFSHEHHVAGLGLDCRYCHTSVETAANAGLPPTKTCMTCHSQIWTEAPPLEPVRRSFADQTPIPWQRVSQLADFVYFDHAIHVAKGIGCTTCHGRVDRMPILYQAKPFQMTFCLDCHREPERYVRPREQVFAMDWTAPSDQLALGRQLVGHYQIDKDVLMNCTTCHR